MREFPAATLIRFFDSHRFLTVSGQAQWKSIAGGCSSYIPRMTCAFQKRIFTGVQMRCVTREQAGVMLRFADGREEVHFDEVVFAMHGDQILPASGRARKGTRDIERISHQPERDVVLHTDERMLPERAAARASWNLLHPWISGTGTVR